MDTYTRRVGPELRRWACVGCTLVAALALAACGSSSSSKSTAAANSAPAPSSGSSTSPSSAGSATSSGVAAAKKSLSLYLKPPTKINISTPLKSPAPRGKTLVEMGTSNPQNVEIQKEFEAVAKAYGWNFSVIDYDPANPAAFNTALHAALQKHPDYINESGTPLTQSEINEVKAAGAKWIPIGVYPIKLSKTVIADPDSYTTDAAQAQAIANLFIAESNGKGNALFVHVPSYPILDGFTQTFSKITKARCPGCKLKFLDVTLPQIANGQVSSAVVAALKADPSANYLIYDDGAWADGVTSSLSAAGLSSQVKIIGQAPDQDEMAETRAGKEVAWSGFNAGETAMQAFDAMFRNLEGMPIPAMDATMPTQAITKTNIGPSDNWTYPTNALQQFEALWNK